jgi:hypothetical protein
MEHGRNKSGHKGSSHWRFASVLMGHFWLLCHWVGSAGYQKIRGGHCSLNSSCFVTGNRAWQGYKAMANE